MSVLSILIAAFKPVILPILTWLVGWLMPSPMQRTAKDLAKIKEAEDKASGPDHDVTDLDKLP